MARKPNELFDKIKIKKLCNDIQITDEQRNAAKEWLNLLENNKLESEQQNRPKFEQIILQKILGFSVYDFIPEKDDIDYTFSNLESGNSLCIEVKGTSTKDLFAYQDRGKKDKENPIAQTWAYMGLGYDYGICTNYDDFILLTMSGRTHKVHKFNFLSIKDTKNHLNEDKLKEFIGIFSKSRIFAEGIVEKLTNESIIAEQEFTNEFYKLFHETRLMLIKEFSSLPDVTKEEAIHWAQIYLNRLIFVFFVEDHNFIPDRLFAKRILSIIKSPSISEHTKIISENINDLFKIMNTGSKIHGINGFNGGLFEQEIPSNIFFTDVKDPQFFKEQRQNSKLSQKSLLVDIDINLSSQYADSLNQIIKNLLIMDSFDFTSDLNVNILGHIFEQSISDLESLHEQETTKRKRDGVYYTPEYITDYICRNTIIPYLSKKGTTSVSKLVEEYANDIEELEDKIRNIKIVDPACGSGAFLVKAVDILLEIDEKIQSYKPQSAITQRGLGEYSKIKEINLIVESNIFGVDINDESVEITKLSLFLKLAGPNNKLSYLSNNIKKGNSLIDDKTVDEYAFCWNDEFPEIFSPLIENKGFDVVIGNPPYVRHELLSDIKDHLQKNYSVFHGGADLYVYFIEKGMSLLKNNGIFSIIVSNKFSKVNYGKKLRDFLLKHKIEKFIDFGDLPVFEDATTYPCIIKVVKSTSTGYLHACNVDTLNFPDLESYLNSKIQKIPISSLGESSWNISGIQSQKILEKLSKNSQLFGDLVNHKIFSGVKTGLNEAFIITNKKREQLIKEDSKSCEIIYPYVAGKEIKRYRIEWENHYIIFAMRGIDIKKYPAIEKHLNIYQKELEPKLNPRDKIGRKPGSYKWYEIQDSVEYWKVFCESGIMYPQFNKRCNFTITTSPFFTNTNGYHIQNQEYWLLALLNSKIVNFYLNSICPFVQGGYYVYLSYNVETIPISLNLQYRTKLSVCAKQILEYQEKILNIKEKSKNRIQITFGIERFTGKLEEISALKFNEFLKEIYKKTKTRLSLKEQDEWEEYFEEKKNSILSLKNEITKLDTTIDSLVYQMYELNDEEIEFIEEYLKR